MRKVRFYCKNLDMGQVELDEVESGHLARVLRMTSGQETELFDGQGTLGQAIIREVKKKKTFLEVVDISTLPPKQSGRIILAVSFAKGQRFDWLVEKCTELNTDCIAAVHYERTVKLGKKNNIERYDKIALSACKQSKRLFTPSIIGPENLSKTIDTLHKNYPKAAYVYGDVVEKCDSLDILANNQQDIAAFIGPEGGFSEQEIKLLQNHNAKPININPNILRIETAAVAFCSIITALRK